MQEGWCEGILNGTKGMFPDNFVKEVKKPERPHEQPQKRTLPTGMNDIRSKLASVITHPPQLPAIKKVTKKAKVLYPYAPLNSDELPLEVGQIVEVLKQEEPGWWEGNLNGQIGMFPSNFVEIIEDPRQQNFFQCSSADYPPVTEAPEIKGRKVIGVGFGPNILANYSKPLKIGNPPRVPQTKKPVPSPASGDKEEKPVLKAKVLYQYKAENSDELNLNVGDLISILDQNLEDVGWWKGEINGKIGVFPDNFVELVSSDEKPQKHAIELPPKAAPHSAVPLSKPKIEEAKDIKITVKTFQPVETNEPDNKTDAAKPFVKVDPAKGLPRKPTMDREEKPVKPAPIQKKEPPKPQLKDSANKELNNLPAPSPAKSVVTSEMFADLQKEVNQLKDQLEKMKKDHEKTLLDLMMEIDEEKKTRYNMQVEIDRIKRLVASSSMS